MLKRIAVFVGLLGLMGPAQASNLPTDLDLVVETIESVVDDALAAMQMPTDSVSAQEAVLLIAEGKHDANWLVEHILAERMLGRGFDVGLDSTQAQEGSVRLSYRVLDFGAHRPLWPAGSQSPAPEPGRSGLEFEPGGRRDRALELGIHPPIER